MKRWMYWLIGFAVLAAGFVGWRIYRTAQARAALTELQLATVERGTLTAEVGATGTLRANQSAALTFETTGIVQEVLVDAGDVVEEGTILAMLEQTSLPTQVILAQADLVSAQRALDDLLLSDTARANAQLALARAQDDLETAEERWRAQQPGFRASADTLAAAEAKLALAEDRLAQAEAAYQAVAHLPEDDPARAQALINLVSARRARNNVRYLVNYYNGSPDEIQQALLDADLEIARATLGDAQRAWERVKDGPNADDSAAAQARVAAAQATLATARISAPFGGTLTYVNVMRGDRVSPGLTAFGLADLSRLLVDVDVSEVDIDRVKIGQRVAVNFDAVPDQTYEGEVVDVALEGIVTQGVVNFRVSVALASADQSIKPGMTAAVSIVVEELQDVLLIPNRAVRVQDGERIVYVLRNGSTVAETVELGASSDLMSELLGGNVQEGDQIVLNPTTSLLDLASGHPGFIGRFGQ